MRLPSLLVFLAVTATATLRADQGPLEIAGRAYLPGAAESIEIRHDSRPIVPGGPALLVRSLMLTLPAGEPAPFAVEIASGTGKAVAVMLRGAGLTAEAWVIADVPTEPAGPAGVETPLSFPDQWRETVPVLAGAVASPKRVTAEELASATVARIELEVFGNDAGRYGDKVLFLGGTKIGTLPGRSPSPAAMTPGRFPFPSRPPARGQS